MTKLSVIPGRRRKPSKHMLEEDQPGRFHLYERVGVELEYMIVDSESLAVRPIADKVLSAVGGEGASEVEFAETAWSNELTLHVLEMKTVEPRGSLTALDSCFQHDVRQINTLLEPHEARLMPTSIHPWMDPGTETKLWPNAQNEIYEAYDRIFGVRGHGWANVQSSHINLPFANEDEFVRLHAAIRVVLPLLPAIAASSPIQDGRVTGMLDSRLMAYSMIQQRVPSVTGRVIPESVHSVDAYHTKILGKMYRDISKFDPDGLLQHEWLNSRGAIARFDRSAIEIRLLDTQEYPCADIAIANAVIELIRALTEERWVTIRKLQRTPGALLERLLFAAIREADQTRIWSRDYMQLFGMKDRESTTMGELWDHIIKHTLAPEDLAKSGWGIPLKRIIQQGPLARRIAKALNGRRDRERMEQVYRHLASCLEEGVGFEGAEF